MSRLPSSTILTRSVSLLICNPNKFTQTKQNWPNNTFSLIDMSGNNSPRRTFSTHKPASSPSPPSLRCFFGLLGGVNKVLGSALARMMMASCGISAGARLFEAKGCHAMSNSSLVVQCVRRCFFRFPFSRHVLPQSGLNSRQNMRILRDWTHCYHRWGVVPEWTERCSNRLDLNLNDFLQMSHSNGFWSVWMIACCWRPRNADQIYSLMKNCSRLRTFERDEYLIANGTLVDLQIGALLPDNPTISWVGDISYNFVSHINIS